MKITSSIGRFIATLALTIAIAFTGLGADTTFPAGSLAQSVVTAHNQTRVTATKADGITALGTALTTIEALDNTTTIPTNQLVGIRVYLGACRGLNAATDARIDAAIILLNGIIAYKDAHQV